MVPRVWPAVARRGLGVFPRRGGGSTARALSEAASGPRSPGAAGLVGPRAGWQCPPPAGLPGALQAASGATELRQSPSLLSKSG